VLVHPISFDWSVGGEVLALEPRGTVVEVSRFEMPSFSPSLRELAEGFGLKLVRMVVDECIARET
jgi:hypothetical protein